MAFAPTLDIFGRRPLEFGGSFAADAARIKLNLNCEGLDELEDAGLLTQQLNIQYQQPINRLYEVGSQKTFYVAGRPQGTATIARVLGPGNVMAAFYHCLGDVCKADQNDLCFCVEASCNLTAGEVEDPDAPKHALKICIKNVVLQSIGFSVQASDMIINEQLSLFFSAMLVDDAQFCEGTQAQAVSCTCFN